VGAFALLSAPQMADSHTFVGNTKRLKWHSFVFGTPKHESIHAHSMFILSLSLLSSSLALLLVPSYRNSAPRGEPLTSIGFGFVFSAKIGVRAFILFLSFPFLSCPFLSFPFPSFPFLSFSCFQFPSDVILSFPAPLLPCGAWRPLDTLA
jgi:hypothetical protein